MLLSFNEEWLILLTTRVVDGFDFARLARVRDVLDVDNLGRQSGVILIISVKPFLRLVTEMMAFSSSS